MLRASRDALALQLIPGVKGKMRDEVVRKVRRTASGAAANVKTLKINREKVDEGLRERKIPARSQNLTKEICLISNPNLSLLVTTISLTENKSHHLKTVVFRPFARRLSKFNYKKNRKTCQGTNILFTA